MYAFMYLTNCSSLTARFNVRFVLLCFFTNQLCYSASQKLLYPISPENVRIFGRLFSA